MRAATKAVSRREFVKGAGLVAGSLAAGAQAAFPHFAPAAQEPLPMPQVTLGRTGQTVSRLGIGCAHFQRTDLSVQDVADVLHRALELGVNYLDVAPNYGTPQTSFSEEKMGPTIKGIRDKVFLVTKTEEASYEGTWRSLRRSMRRLQTDHFDLVHLHNFGNVERFPDLQTVLGPKGALGALLEAQKKGVVRFIGASGHLHPARFHAVLDTGKIDVLMNAVNLVTQHVYDFEHKVWCRARQQNLGLVAMKVLGGTGRGRRGFRLPKELYSTAIRYALSVPGISVAIIGVQNIRELEQAAATVAGAKPFSEAEAYQAARTGLELAGQKAWHAPYGTPIT